MNTLTFETYPITIDDITDGLWVAAPKNDENEMAVGVVYNVKMGNFFSLTGEKTTEKLFMINFSDADCEFKGQEDIEEYRIVGVAFTQ